MGAPFDVFPAIVTGPEGDHRSVRVLVDDNARLLIFREGPALVATVALGAVPEAGRAQTTLTDTEGRIWRVSRAGGCGCGSRLRRMSREALVSLAQ